MRIAHVILSSGFAGSERATAEMCNAHCTTHQVLLILKRAHAGRGGVSIRDWVDPAVEIVEVSNWLPRAGIAKELERFKPDIIHAHLRRATRMLARIHPKAPTIATLHLTVNGPHFAEMDGLICIAQWQRQDIPQHYRGKLFFINESLIPNRRLSTEEIQKLRNELGVQPGEYLIGGVGRLARSKGFDVLIEAFRHARETCGAFAQNTQLVILGEGRERKRLERLIANAGPAAQFISLPGFRNNVKDYYQAFDLFVSPSRSEPLGRVILEALDAGVPVVAAATQGPNEILAKYPGDLFAIGDTEKLAELLKQHHAARTPHTTHDLSPYHLERIERQTEAAYRELIAAKATASS